MTIGKKAITQMSKTIEIGFYLLAIGYAIALGWMLITKNKRG